MRDVWKLDQEAMWRWEGTTGDILWDQSNEASARLRRGGPEIRGHEARR